MSTDVVAIENFEQNYNIIKLNSLDENADIRIADAQFLIGSCLMKNNKAHEAVVLLKSSLKIRKNISIDANPDSNVCKVLKELSVCLNQLKKTEIALDY